MEKTTSVDGTREARPVPLDVLMSEIMERRKTLREWERQRYLLRKSTPLDQLRELNSIIRRERAFLKDLSWAAAQYELPLK